MAREYRPYTTGRQGKNRRLKMVMLTLIVVIVGLVILIKSQKGQPAEQSEPTPLPRVALNDVLPPSRSALDPARSATQNTTSAPVTPAPVTATPVTPAPVTPAPVTPVPDIAASVEPAPAAATTPETAPVQPSPVPVEAVEDAMEKTSLEAQQLIEKALKLRDSGNIVAARDLLNDALNMQLSPQVRAGVKIQMSKMSDLWLFSKDVLQGDKLTSLYLVQSGDLLSKISSQHKVPYEILMKINDIARPESLRAGRRIKVIHGPFNAVINRTTFTMDLYLQTVYVKSYKVGLGKPEHTTPTGRWVAAPGGKMISPTWTDPDTGKTYLGSDPDYPLGSRWIALDGIEGNAKGRTGFALHGTKDPDTIGTQSSRGCIRLFNGDVIEVYNLLEPGQSSVVVTD